MAKYTIKDTTLTGIAEAIRAKGGTSAALTPAQMAEAIAAIEAGGGIENYKVLSGTFTVAETLTDSYTIEHEDIGSDVIKNDCVFIIFQTHRTRPMDTTGLKAYIASYISKTASNISGGTTACGVLYASTGGRTYGVGGSARTDGYVLPSGTYVTAKLTPGVEYLWVRLQYIGDV